MMRRLSRNERHSSQRDVISTRQYTSSHRECQHGLSPDGERWSHSLPAFSPDPSPIEHMWHQMGRQIARRVPRPQMRMQLIQALQEECHRIPQDRIRCLVCNMRQMCLTCANANGGHTRYCPIMDYGDFWFCYCVTHTLIADVTLFLHLFVIYYGGICHFYEFKHVICLHLLLVDIKFMLYYLYLYWCSVY